MARRVEQIHNMIAVGKLHHRGGHRDAALLLERHPVRGRMPARLTALDGTCELDSATVKQQFFSQRGFAGVRMRDDRKGTAFADVLRKIGHGTGRNSKGAQSSGKRPSRR